MARQARTRTREPLPPPLPPETRTVGQLVAESVNFYRHNFFQSLPLGLSVAALEQFAVAFGHRHVNPRGHPPAEGIHDPQALLGGGLLTTMLVGGLLLTLSYIAATVLVSGVRPDARRTFTAYAAGVLVFLPVPILVGLFVLPAVAWLGFVGLVVPVAIIEGSGIRASFSRATRLARTDYVHAVGGLATLVIVFYVTHLVLFFLLRSGGESTARIAAFLADLVLSPFLFIGSALLYYDQAARAAVKSGSRPTRRRDAHVRDADHADRAGGADAQVQP